MNLKGFPLVFSLLLFNLFAQAQSAIETRLTYTYQDKFDFSAEWQYLSTDIYLMNASKFNRVVNELENGAGRDKKKYRNSLEFLFITAQLKNIKVFGNESIVYPLYNFSLKPGSQKEMEAEISDNIDVIRIIDKLPVSDAAKSIDATISAKAITNDDGTEMYNIVSSQLLNISKLTNPTSALLSLVGEFGNLLNSSSKKKEYRFSSTIRLYEGQNFDTRLHSVRIYVLVPTDAKLQTMRLPKFTEQLNNLNGGNLDRQRMESLINYKEYPFLVIANYKSLYKTDALSGNEISAELIEKRKQKISSAHDAGLVNDETFKQEMYFIEFLRTFADLKQNLNSYKLNYKNNVSEANSKSLFAIIQNYKTLKATQRLREKEFAKQSTFQNIFKPEYQAIVTSAELYLEGDHNLKNSKELVLTLLELENDLKNTTTAARRENYLTRLHSVDLPGKDFLSATIEGEAITRYIAALEEAQFNEVFEKEVVKVTQLPATDDNLPVRNALMEKAGATKCVSCRERVKEAVLTYNKRYDAYKLETALKRTDELKKKTEGKINEFLKKKYCIDNNIVSSFPKDALPAFIIRYKEKNDELGKNTESLITLTKETVPSEKAQLVNDYNQKLEAAIKQIETGFTEICTAEKNLCGCYSN